MSDLSSIFPREVDRLLQMLDTLQKWADTASETTVAELDVTDLLACFKACTERGLVKLPNTDTQQCSDSQLAYTMQFAEAGIMVEKSAKILSCRIEALYQQAYQIVTDWNRAHAKQEKRSKLQESKVFDKLEDLYLSLPQIEKAKEVEILDHEKITNGDRPLNYPFPYFLLHNQGNKNDDAIFTTAEKKKVSNFSKIEKVPTYIIHSSGTLLLCRDDLFQCTSELAKYQEELNTSRSDTTTTSMTLENSVSQPTLHKNSPVIDNVLSTTYPLKDRWDFDTYTFSESDMMQLDDLLRKDRGDLSTYFPITSQTTRKRRRSAQQENWTDNYKLLDEDTCSDQVSDRWSEIKGGRRPENFFASSLSTLSENADYASELEIDSVDFCSVTGMNRILRMLCSKDGMKRFDLICDLFPIIHRLHAKKWLTQKFQLQPFSLLFEDILLSRIGKTEKLEYEKCNSFDETSIFDDMTSNDIQICQEPMNNLEAENNFMSLQSSIDENSLAQDEAVTQSVLYEAILKGHIQRLKDESNLYDIIKDEAEIQQRVRRWNEMMEMQLKMAEKKGSFDINEYEIKIMDSIIEKKHRIKFRDLVRGQEKHEICRTFLTALMLINKSKLAIEDSYTEGNHANAASHYHQNLTFLDISSASSQEA